MNKESALRFEVPTFLGLSVLSVVGVMNVQQLMHSLAEELINIVESGI